MNETKTERRSGKGLLIAQISVVLILVLVIVTYFAPASLNTRTHSFASNFDG